MQCNHNPYWITAFGNCMVCRAENAESQLRAAQQECERLQQRVAELERDGR